MNNEIKNERNSNSMQVFLGDMLVIHKPAYPILASVGMSAWWIDDNGTKEYWMIHVKTPEVIETVVPDSPASLTDYDVWGEAVARSIEELNVYPELPKMIPDGYEYVSTKDISVEGFYTERQYVFEHPNGNYIQLNVRVMDVESVDSDIIVQKDESTNETVFHKDLEIAVSQNYGSVSATWISGNCRISIIGICSMEELNGMIASI